MKKHILSLALIAMVSIAVYGQEIHRTEPMPANAESFAMTEQVEISVTPDKYHILDLRKVDLDKGTNLGRLKIQSVPNDPVFKNKLASDQNLQEFVFISNGADHKKLVLLLPKSMILAGAYTERLPAIVPRIPAGNPGAAATTRIYETTTPVKTVPATRSGE
ncbi:hypothetical protein HDE69_000538 [Pedobacter cryoconitis]|uniref:Uncharacterized protein n=1 Tax=Pedobacter cryoconitis TaxID=188932 RepID=A0A7W8YPW4_9SPHI|nr:hypothetical protein [Pedobacter cryoconitis]MBB5619502.1 hypothetical protein [Pedobacter cryoconitis]MBB5644792.1 hypothetical protein [Pedobacter cryoconitis]